ncbi:DUF3307 domain-containing protein [Peribacillus frigoritolerans]|uniref:DUF3307 domain-containing protein n=1 Tax=Peribacillus frigoritolerans TaxID=450367 RepID=UPI0032B44D05
MSEEIKDNKSRLDFLYKAIDDAQNTIRFTDTKAGAVIGFWTLVLTLVLRSGESLYSKLFSQEVLIEQLMIVIFIIILVYFFCNSIWMAYLTLVPRINPKVHINSIDLDVENLFFLAETQPDIQGKYLYNNYDELQMKLGAKDYHTKLTALDSEGIEKELIIELQKVSFIRNLKLARTNLAITSVINSLISMILLALYFIGEKIFIFKGGVILDNFTLNVTLFIILYIGHKIADYLFQTEYQALNKQSNWGALLRHCTIYTLIITLLAFITIGFFSWTAVFILFISHVIIDKRGFLIWWARRVKKMADTNNQSQQPVLNELDQAFHYIILFIVSFL